MGGGGGGGPRISITRPRSKVNARKLRNELLLASAGNMLGALIQAHLALSQELHPYPSMAQKLIELGARKLQLLNAADKPLGTLTGPEPALSGSVCPCRSVASNNGSWASKRASVSPESVQICGHR